MKDQNKKRKLLYIASNDISRQSADIVNIMEMCNAFTKYGYKTCLVTPNHGIKKNEFFKHYEVQYHFDIKQIHIPKIFIDKYFPGLSFYFSWKLLLQIMKFKCDIYYTRTIWVFFIVSILFKRKCFLEAHQFRFYIKIQEYIYRILVKISTKYGNGQVICISNKLKEQWLEYGIESKKLFVAHDSYNIKRYKKNISKEEARQILKLENNQSIVIYTGSLIPGKGVEVLLQAANIIPNINFVIVGGRKDDIFKIKKIVHNNNVIFRGYVPPKQITLYQYAADILALPNSKGSVIDDVTSPIKLFEYLASRRPIVATDIPSILEILEHNYNALISPAGDYYKLAKNIILLNKDPSIGYRLVKNALIEIEKYSWDARVQYLSKLFKNTENK